MSKRVEEPHFEVVDDSTQTLPPSLQTRRTFSRLYVLRGWKATVLAAPLIAAALAMLLALGAAIAAVAAVAGLSVGGGLIARRLISREGRTRKLTDSERAVTRH